uniref:Uncharacterized protein n=1 Tax=Anser cygnoides TaxID=8845 RepID=A0A8B9E5F7_ANSCY
MSSLKSEVITNLLYFFFTNTCSDMPFKLELTDFLVGRVVFSPQTKSFISKQPTGQMPSAFILLRCTKLPQKHNCLAGAE